MKRRYTLLLWLVRLTYSKWYLKKNKVQYKNYNEEDYKEGSFLLLCNHCGAYDPIIISSFFPRTVRWVTGAYLFKNWFLRLVFKYGCRCIAKQQGQSDLSTIREMQRALKDGDVVGLFPEGTRTWDGEMMPYSKTVLSKMIRNFKAPVVFVNLEGCYAQQPRWADYYRKGQGVVVNFTKTLSAEEVAQMSIQELEESLAKYLDFSNDRWKETNQYVFESEHRAEGAQRLFYMCPKCKNVATIQTKDDKIFCTHCGATVTVTEKDDLESDSISFKTFAQWHEWEKQNIINAKQFPKEKGILFQIGKSDNNAYLKTISKDFDVTFSDNIIKVDCAGQSWNFELDKISSLILNTKQTMELVYEDLIYRIRLSSETSSLKYHEYYLSYKEGQKT